MSGALGIEQVKKLPMLIEERRKNGDLLQQALKDHSDLLIQSEIGQSSWFGFSLVIKPGSKLSRKELVMKLIELGFECRPIVAGNFAKNEVVKYFNSEVHRDLKNAEHIDQNGLFIGNHHYPISDAIQALNRVQL
jgi:CDP-6-deoxy-D-xylo-4-hexulose-3-dehydrase